MEAARPGEKEELLTWAMVILPLAGVSIDLEFTLVVEALGRNLINSIVCGQKGQLVYLGWSIRKKGNQSGIWVDSSK